jgi:soluble cytochrome b562
MKVNKTMTALALGAALALGQAAVADDGHDHGNDHAYGEKEAHFQVKAPDNVKEAWTLLTTKTSEVEKALGATDLKAAHEGGEYLEAAVHTLQEKSDMVPAEAKAKLASALKQLDKSVDELHHAAEEGNADASQSALTKIKGLLPLVEGLYPAGSIK